MKESIIERPYYTEKIRPHIRQLIIKILTGQRRIGKSCILRQLMDISRGMDGENTKNREVASLLKTMDSFPKYIVTLDDFALGATSDGIQIIHLREFLMK